MPSRVSERGEPRDEDRAERRERRKHKSTRIKKRSSSKENVESGTTERNPTLAADTTPRRKASLPIPELQRRASLTMSANGSRTSLPYPTFSKAHSREAVGSKENIAPRKDIFTPDPTDLDDVKSKNDGQRKNSATVNTPPSPPLTADDQAAIIEDKRKGLEEQGRDIHRKFSQSRLSKGAEDHTTRPTSTQTSPLKAARVSSKSSVSSLRKNGTPTKRSKSTKLDEVSSNMSKRKSRTPSPASSARTEIKTSTATVTNYSDSTSVASKQPAMQTPFTPDADDERSPSEVDSSPKTPTPRGTPAPTTQTPVYNVSSLYGYHAPTGDSPMPPPPPPPPSMPFVVAPRVDYLMLHGGLNRDIPKQFLSAPNPIRTSSYVVGELPNPSLIKAQVDGFFSPFSHLLEDYTKVMERNGSIAVATGYRSIARRLLDRLEAVFARDLSSEVCACQMCDEFDDRTAATELGISWGEILEYVAGRQELPPWPPFDFDHEPVGLGISDIKAPMQKLDIDVPEEYREHYIRQSKKTKQSVDRWLAGQSNDASNPPDEADDDTLTFAILTHLESHERPVFSQLLGVSVSRPPSIQPGSRTATPLNAPKSELLANTGLALQRLYRLSNVPRSPECALFLLNNKPLHNVLATLAAVSDGEWDILTSGRFDGFLRSGADEGTPTASAPPSRGPSRGASRGPTPGLGSISSASAGAPVAMDEETEIAVLAEVEREIFLGMEALEDAFEALHARAEVVRKSLRERSAGLSMAAQARKGSGANIVEARLGTPASARGWDSETDDGIDDGMSELAPDDSASNISSSRHRRPRRRNERRTPAPVEEESEEEDISRSKEQRHSWGKQSKRR